MESILALFIPIAICVILPIMIVWLLSRTKTHEIDKKTEVMLKAIENGQEIDPELFTGPKSNNNISTKKMLLNRLQNGIMICLIGIVFLVSSILGYSFIPITIQITCGGIFLSLGIGLLVAYFVGKKMLAMEIKAEEEQSVRNL